MTKILGILVCLGAMGGGAAWWVNKDKADENAGPSDAGLYTVTRGDVVISLAESGTLVAKESRKVQSGARRSGKITWLVEEGKVVEEGEVVCTLDTTDLVTKIEEIELSIVQTEANLKSARTEVDIQKTENVANVEKAHQALDKAKKQLEKYRDGDAPKERRGLEIAIKDAETQFRQAKKRYEDSLELMKEDYIKKTELEQDEISFEKAQVQKEGAELDLRMFEKYTLPMGMGDKETAVKDATRTVTTSEKRAESALNQKQVRVTEHEKRQKRNKKRLGETKEMVEQFTLKAPCPGVIIYGNPREPWYRDNVKVGGTVWGGNPVMTIPDLREMQVKMKIHEADINKVKADLEATITMDSYPGLILKGKVTKIATVAGGGNSWSGGSSVKKFDVEITIDGDTSELKLKPGISAKAEVMIDTIKDALSVPLQCVFVETGKHYAYALGKDGQTERREVEVGLSNDSVIVITSGLDEGDRVLLYNPDLPTSSSSSQDDEKKDDETELGEGDRGDGSGGANPGPPTPSN